MIAGRAIRMRIRAALYVLAFEMGGCAGIRDDYVRTGGSSIIDESRFQACRRKIAAG